MLHCLIVQMCQLEICDDQQQKDHRKEGPKVRNI